MGRALKTIPGLIERFGRNIDAYRAGRYNETEVRHDFIDPLFEALGWDINNRAGYAEAYRDVIHEDAIKVGGVTKAPDYCFRIGGTRKFFVEAKKPSIDIAHDVHPAYQLRRYAWSAKLPLSILTDFEELAVYDCRVRPKARDKAGVARTMYFTYEHYADKWDQIASVFCKEAVLQGSFDKYVVGRKKRGTAEVDAEFLKEIEKWRGALARNIAPRNPRLNVREINFAVQRTIDRIIFLRMAEDRGVEEYATLQALINGTEVYGRLMQMFRAADDRYNSGLFHFNDEPGRDHPPDTLTPEINIDDKVLKGIFKGLYYPDSPYEFSVLPADILGNVYEQFLGKVIHLTKGHQARVDEKPEVKKAGGVYYTPKYIVDYIVKHTVGRLVDGKTPRQISGMKVLDPACGSGSFLVGAYKFLLDYHRDWYVSDGPEKHTKEIYQGAGAQWYLTTAVKKKILLKNIYGVDIDSQAVEVTKLNLLLCVLENENQGTVGQMALIHQRVLPDLSDNIKCGNSLIGPDFYEGTQLVLFDEEARIRINAFDWPAEFPKILGPKAGKNPGFDAVIGNPPYVRQEAFTENKEYFRRHYETFHTQNDLYVYFMEKGSSLISRNGFYGIIVSRGFLRTAFAAKLREYLRSNYSIQSIVDFGGLPAFSNAKDTYVCIPIIARLTPNNTVNVTKVTTLENIDLEQIVPRDSYPVPIEALTREAWSLDTQEKRAVFAKVRAEGTPLASFVDRRLFSGIKTGLNKAFVISESQRSEFVTCFPRCEDVLRPFAAGQHIRRYWARETRQHLIVIPCGWTSSRVKVSPGKSRGHKEREAWRWLNDEYEPIATHLSQFEDECRRRQDHGEFWWELRPCDYYGALDSAKIVYPDITKGPRFYLDTVGTYIGNTAYCLGTDDRYLLGILNSQLGWFCVGCISIPFGIRAGRYRYRMIYQYMKDLPIRQIDFTNSADKARHDRMVGLVEQMLKLHKDLAAAKMAHGKTLLQRQIDTTDKQIDQLVYELYGLTEEEIRIIEEARS